MVAVIHTGSSLNNAVNYNEQKIRTGRATCLMAGNYPKDVGELNFHQKLNRLLNLAALNQRAKVKSVHISLNFDPSEKLAKSSLTKIASAYMQKIGFGEQPYLVYEHHDAGHPHVHIVTTNIQRNGKRITLHNLGRDQSEKARKEIETAFGLMHANHKKTKCLYETKPVNAQKIHYGKSETRRAITNVLAAVVNQYKYTSLHELNAVLKSYNVIADGGSEESRTYQQKGLVYRVLDNDGNKTGVPIKASLIYNQPTLKYLESKFNENKIARQPHRQRLRTIIDFALLKTKDISMQQFIDALEKERIRVVLRQNEKGLIYGITYIDHQTKCVFNGSDAGKQYGAKGIQDRLNTHTTPQTSAITFSRKADYQSQEETGDNSAHPLEKNDTSKIVDALIMPRDINSYIPYQLKRSKKKKKKKRLLI